MALFSLVFPCWYSLVTRWCEQSMIVIMAHGIGMCLWSLGSQCMIYKPLDVGNFHVWIHTSHWPRRGYTLDVEDENIFNDLACTHTLYKWTCWMFSFYFFIYPTLNFTLVASYDIHFVWSTKENRLCQGITMERNQVSTYMSYPKRKNLKQKNYDPLITLWPLYWWE